MEMTRLEYLICGFCLQALPEDKKVLSAELFWLAFRLHAGLPLSPRDAPAGVDIGSDKSVAIGDLFESNEKQGCGSREMALLMLCSFAEGSFKKKSKVVTPTVFALAWCRRRFDNVTDLSRAAWSSSY